MSITIKQLLDDLAGVTELAALTGESRGLVSMWQRREDFPAPVLTLAAGRIYRASEVIAWRQAQLKARQA